MRCTTCRTLVSCPGLPGSPALRKYLLTTMSVASCDHVAGTSTSSIWKTIEPSGFAMTVRRFSHAISSSGLTPGRVKWRGTRSPAWVGGASAAAASGAEPAPPVSVWVMGTSLVLLATRNPSRRSDRGGAASGCDAPARFDSQRLLLPARVMQVKRPVSCVIGRLLSARTRGVIHCERCGVLYHRRHAPRARAKFTAKDAAATQRTPLPRRNDGVTARAPSVDVSAQRRRRRAQVRAATRGPGRAATAGGPWGGCRCRCRPAGTA